MLTRDENAEHDDPSIQGRRVEDFYVLRLLIYKQSVFRSLHYGVPHHVQSLVETHVDLYHPQFLIFANVRRSIIPHSLHGILDTFLMTPVSLQQILYIELDYYVT